MPNLLIHESSPYLLQHAHNPVNWQPWSEKAFQTAVAENKLVIVSIGYSACHWCHVMEHESFEDEQVAKVMNKNFICIKVDREERPDIDQFFMDAAQLMIGRGGWPLNAVALPDGRPVYAGTYFPKTSWIGLLNEIAIGYKNQPEKYLEYAGKLVAGIKSLSVINIPQEEKPFSLDDLDEAYSVLSSQFDRKNGGRGRAPKFPMPDNWQFTLRYHYVTKNEEALQQSLNTLDKMATAGIYDQLGGGFARYATDAGWKIPHFEKMLYDNAQLISLYSAAYSITKKELYKTIVYETIEFIDRELKSPSGGFYCAIDADSEGVEGKFYVWTSDEVEHIVGKEHFSLIKDYFGIDNEALWENGLNILLIASDTITLSEKHHISEEKYLSIIADAKQKLLKERNKRIRPGTDNKILLSWNALMIKGLIDAYLAFDEPVFLELASSNLSFLRKEMVSYGKLFHSYNANKAAIPGFLEDYAMYISALIAYYRATFDEYSLFEARALIEYVINHFKDNESGFFWFTSEENNELAARKIETSDNVIPSPNSVMARNLFVMGKLFSDDLYSDISKKMLLKMIPNITEQSAYYSNWAILLADNVAPFYEVAFTGEKALVNMTAFSKYYIPNKIEAGAIGDNSNLPLLQNKTVPGKSLIYVCENFTCQTPVETVSEAVLSITNPDKG